LAVSLKHSTRGFGGRAGCAIRFRVSNDVGKALLARIQTVRHDSATSQADQQVLLPLLIEAETASHEFGAVLVVDGNWRVEAGVQTKRGLYILEEEREGLRVEGDVAAFLERLNGWLN
jgi:hypothetical protein